MSAKIFLDIVKYQPEGNSFYILKYKLNNINIDNDLIFTVRTDDKSLDTNVNVNKKIF